MPSKPDLSGPTEASIVAHHEAGHAVMGHMQGISLQSVSAEPGEDWAGATEFNSWFTDALIQDQRKEAEEVRALWMRTTFPPDGDPTEEQRATPEGQMKLKGIERIVAHSEGEFIHGDIFPADFDREIPRRAIEAYILKCYAGYAAQKLHDPQATKERASGDYKSVDELRHKIYGENVPVGEEWAAYRRWLELRAMTLLKLPEYQAAVDAMVEALLKGGRRRTITGDEVEAIIEGAESQPHHVERADEWRLEDAVRGMRERGESQSAIDATMKEWRASDKRAYG